MGFGGKEKQLYYLIKHLPDDVCKQLIVLSDKILHEDVSSYIDSMHVVKRDQKYTWKTWSEIYKVVRQFSPTIIHCWDGISPFIIKPLAIKNNIPLINGSLRDAMPRKKMSKKQLLADIRHKISDLNISNSAKGLDVYNMAGHKKGMYIHNGFDLDEFDKKKQIDAQPCVYSKDAFNVCMVGRFMPLKDYLTYIRAAKLVGEKDNSIHFYALGEGPAQNKCKELAENLAVKNVHFMGKHQNVPSFLSCCNLGIILNPYDRGEGISNAIMEYMAAGLPVIATNRGGTPELVSDGKNGYLVEPGDAVTVAEKILLMKNNIALCVKMGTKGKRNIEANFTLKAMLENYIDVYKNLTTV